jgi:octaprenyl-diphosphate synthase
VIDLLSSEQGLDALHSVAELKVPAHSALQSARALFIEDLGYVDEAMESAARDGESPGADAAAHLARSGGKRIRALALLLSNACYGSVGAPARELSLVAEMVHAATLLHDDVIDDGDERRGVPTARRIYGNAVSVLAGDLLLTHALDRTAAVDGRALSDLLTTLRRLVDGEIVQLRGRTELDLSPRTYDRIVEGKTASLFGWASRNGARLGGAREADVAQLGMFGELLGTAFQLVDDALDYEGDPRISGKALLADLHEGKVTLPLALAVERDPKLLSDVLLVRDGDTDAAGRVAKAVLRLDVCTEVRRRADAHTDRARRALSSVPPSPARDLLHRVARELVGRKR